MNNTKPLTPQLTEKQLALYLGCEAELKYDPTGTGKVELLRTSIKPITADVLAELGVYYSVKPILRRLESITEEEVVEGGFYKYKEADQFFEEWVQSWVSRIKKFTPKQFAYLLSKGFDLKLFPEGTYILKD